MRKSEIAYVVGAARDFIAAYEARNPDYEAATLNEQSTLASLYGAAKGVYDAQRKVDGDGFSGRHTEAA